MSAPSYEDVRQKSEQLLKRAGLSSVPPGILLALALVLVIAVGFAVWRWSTPGPGLLVESHSGRAVETSASLVSAESESALETVSAEPRRIWVHVVGAVLRPGVYELLEGARVSQAVAAAGGLLGSAAEAGVNLARDVSDGEQVVVPTLDQFEAGTIPVAGGPSAGGTSVGGSAQAGGLVNINTAGASELESLSGVGPSTAAKIIADREANGPFASVEDLLRVSGIGQKKLEALRDSVTVR